MRDPAGGYRADGRLEAMRRAHERETARERRWFRWAVVAAVGWTLVCVGALGVAGYVAYHFVAKWW